MTDRPLGVNKGARGDEEFLEIELPQELLTDFEVMDEGKWYREWCVPAELLNTRGTVRLLDE